MTKTIQQVLDEALSAHFAATLALDMAEENYGAARRERDYNDPELEGARAAAEVAQARLDGEKRVVLTATLARFKQLLFEREQWPSGGYIKGDDHAAVVTPEGNYPPYAVCRSEILAAREVLREVPGIDGGDVDWREEVEQALVAEMWKRSAAMRARPSADNDVELALAAWFAKAECGEDEGLASVEIIELKQPAAA